MIEKPQHTSSMSVSEDYDKHWGFTSFQDKTILDLGADWGSTVHYFLQHGSKKVIAVEGDKKRAAELFANYDEVPNVVCIEKNVKSCDDFEGLILKYNPDIVKCDIEGCERYLLDVPSVFISSVEEWLVETHGDEMFTKHCDLFKSLGYEVSVHYVVIKGGPWRPIRVVWAKKLKEGS